MLSSNSRATSKKTWAISDKALELLYHHSDHFSKEDLPCIPLERVPDLRNPIVNTILYELRRLVNDLLHHHPKPDTIRIEMASELTKGKKAKFAIEKRNRRNEAERSKAKALLAEWGKPITNDNIRKVVLWNEAGKHCIYTGNYIAHAQLFDGSYEIDHIVPREISHDNSYYNLTLCPADENVKKGKRTPYQYLAYDLKRWPVVQERAKKAFSLYKHKHFVNDQEPMPGMKPSQLVDSSYMAREARKLLFAICNRVECSKGGVTALMRQQWGLNGLLTPTVSFSDTHLTEGNYYFFVDENDTVVLDTLTPDPAEPLGLSDLEKGDDKAKKAAYKAWQSAYNGRVKKIKESLKKKYKQGRVCYGSLKASARGSMRLTPNKTRDDQRHHLVDAIVVALASAAHNRHWNKLTASGKSYSDISKKIEQEKEQFLVTPPHPNFYESVKTLLQKTLVSYRQTNHHYQKRAQVLPNGERHYHGGVRGPLHKESYYGKRGNNLYTLKKRYLNSLQVSKRRSLTQAPVKMLKRGTTPLKKSAPPSPIKQVIQPCCPSSGYVCKRQSAMPYNLAKGKGKIAG